MQTSADEFFTAEQEDARERAYRLMLVERYQAGLPLPAADRREARKLIREAKAFAKQAFLAEQSSKAALAAAKE